MLMNKMKLKTKKISIFIILILGLIFLTSCNKKLSKYEKEAFLFGTYVRITVYSDNKKSADSSMEKAFEEIKRIDKKYNSKTKNSLVHKFNNSKEKRLVLDEEGNYIFSKINDAYRESNGSYDITIGPLLNLWGFNKGERETIPTSQEISETLKNINYSNIKIEENILKANEETIDTGSFLKGYAIEKAKEVLMENGITNGFVSSISSIGTIGGKPEGTPWKIGLQDPSNSRKSLGNIELIGRSLGVTGDYQTYVTINDKKYHHVLDKATGYPITDKKMVAVISDSAFLADIYSTAFFGMEIEEIEKVAKEKNVEFIIIKSDNSIIKSKNFKIN